MMIKYVENSSSLIYGRDLRFSATIVLHRWEITEYRYSSPISSHYVSKDGGEIALSIRRVIRRYGAKNASDQITRDSV